jgi:arsenate reductase
LAAVRNLPSRDGNRAAFKREVRHERQHVMRPMLPRLPARRALLPAGLSMRRQVTPPRGGCASAARHQWVLLEPLIGMNMSDKPLILVLCTGNSARSQIAEAFLRKFKGDRFTAASAGTQPKSEVHPMAVGVMKEIGIDISAQRPKDLREFLDKAAVRHVLIVCDNANQSCPRIWPGTFSRTFMPFDDPAAATGSEDQKLQVFRCVRDEISEAIQKWTPEPTQGTE